MKKLVLAGAVILLGGCSTAGELFSSKVDYKSAGTLPTLEVPPDLTAPARDTRYVVPETGKSSATLSGYQAERREQNRAGNTAVLPQVERMRIERAGAERWLVVQDQIPEKLWPVVKDFWQENGFLIKTEVPEAGVLETDWAENRANIPEGGIRSLLGKFTGAVYSTAERDKFRIRLDRTPDGKGSEIYISHRGMVEVYTTPRDVAGTTGQTAWQPRPSDSGLEAEFLRRLMVRLGAQEEKAKALAASDAAPMQSRAEIKRGGDGAELLRVYEPFDRAWRRVGLALDRVGFTVEDRDRQKGLYFVRYADPEAEMEKKDRDRGFLARIFGSSDPKTKAEHYRVEVKQDADGSLVNVFNKDGGAESSRTAQRILALLHEQLK
ncbi:MAG TPA: outer membrane protein assembly factor BamC [Burkholderiales bacterium]|nr:outer membrane protein assembly factor BamC [Burkholderiales bacterium]